VQDVELKPQYQDFGFRLISQCGSCQCRNFPNDGNLVDLNRSEYKTVQCKKYILSTIVALCGFPPPSTN